MNKLIRALSLSFLAILFHTSHNCVAAGFTEQTPLTEDKIFEKAIKELKKQDKRYSASKYEYFKLSKEGSYWVFQFERKNKRMTGGHGSIQIREDGTVMHYFGGL